MFLIVFILVILKVLLELKEYFDVPEYMKHKTKSFDDEKYFINMYGEDAAFLGQPSKSFDSERQGIDMYGLKGGFEGTTLKYY